MSALVWLAMGSFSAAMADPAAAGEATAYLVVPIMFIMGGVAVLKWMFGGSGGTPAVKAAPDPNASKWSQMSPLTKYGGGCVLFFVLVGVLGILVDIATHVVSP